MVAVSWSDPRPPDHLSRLEAQTTSRGLDYTMIWLLQRYWPELLARAGLHVERELPRHWTGRCPRAKSGWGGGRGCLGSRSSVENVPSGPLQPGTRHAVVARDDLTHVHHGGTVASGSPSSSGAGFRWASGCGTSTSIDSCAGLPRLSAGWCSQGSD